MCILCEYQDKPQHLQLHSDSGANTAVKGPYKVHCSTSSIEKTMSSSKIKKKDSKKF